MEIISDILYWISTGLLVPVIVALDKLDEIALINILKNLKNSLFKDNTFA